MFDVSIIEAFLKKKACIKCCVGGEEENQIIQLNFGFTIIFSRKNCVYML